MKRFQGNDDWLDLRIDKYTNDSLWIYFTDAPRGNLIDPGYGKTRPIINFRVDLGNEKIEDLIRLDTPTLDRYFWSYRKRKTERKQKNGTK